MVETMLRARDFIARLSTRLKSSQGRQYCNTPTTTEKKSNSDKLDPNASGYSEAYKKLDNLDFMTASKILFTDPPKKKKFGIDFHLVQLFFACLPSFAVYLVAQYARHEMRKMDAELEKKKKKEEEKAKEMELNAAKEEEARSDSKLLEVKVRLDKLEEVVKKIAVETKKQLRDSTTKNQKDGGEKKHPERVESGNIASRSESTISVKSEELTPGLDQGKVSGVSPQPDAS
ncbi:hypothetical protein HS088_TW10G00775 [Tripterygium wilfordii]|uniref:Uncharacterized protein n=1 Tax=Tripterygium wilfordii TaxID=458696 RepID=A0A7J7D679_TRIWF|nr:uncharacterized protein LOC120007832 [Tripterygium wilfordii]KAF5741769.1 hypothetical protein HS088_TW10G00775 [Tripterygium wilfordii]